MFELSKMFLLCLNYWKLETPSQFRQRAQKDDGSAYKVDYTRCLIEFAFVFLFYFCLWMCSWQCTSLSHAKEVLLL